MAVRKDSEELVVITKAYDFILWSCHHTGKFPRNHRFVLGERIERNLGHFALTNLIHSTSSLNVPAFLSPSSRPRLLPHWANQRRPSITSADLFVTRPVQTGRCTFTPPSAPTQEPVRPRTRVVARESIARRYQGGPSVSSSSGSDSAGTATRMERATPGSRVMSPSSSSFTTIP